MTKQTKRVSKFVDKPFDFVLFIVVMLLLALGLIMVLSASSPSSLAETGDDSYVYFKKQGGFAILGIVAMMVISKIDYRFYKKISKNAYIIGIVLLLLVLVPKVGKEVNGATRWVKILGIQFQPSELMKIACIIFFASYLTDNRKELQGFWDGFVKPFCILAPVILILLLVQDHLSASIIIILVVSIMMIMAGSRIRYFMTAGVAGAAAGGLGLYLMAKFTEKGAFRLERIVSFLDPWADAKDSGWQIIQSLYAIGSGGLFGVGLRRK